MAGTPKHLNGSADIAEQTFKWGLGRVSKQVVFINTHPAKDLFISFNGGLDFFTVKANGGGFDLPIEVFGFVLKAEADGTTFESLAVL